MEIEMDRWKDSGRKDAASLAASVAAAADFLRERRARLDVDGEKTLALPEGRDVPIWPLEEPERREDDALVTAVQIFIDAGAAADALPVVAAGRHYRFPHAAALEIAILFAASRTDEAERAVGALLDAPALDAAAKQRELEYALAAIPENLRAAANERIRALARARRR
jgi:hypothetical protein